MLSTIEGKVYLPNVIHVSGTQSFLSSLTFVFFVFFVRVSDAGCWM